MSHAYLGGIAARSESYMRAHWDHAKGFLDDAGLEAARREEERTHVEVQTEAGLDLLSPALVNWEDLMRPLTWRGKPCEAGHLTRTFETNTFFRQPHLTGDLPAPEPAAWLKNVAIPPRHPWALTLPSPWDFAVRAQDDASKPAERAVECGRALNRVVAEAVRRGAEVVRFHDPSVLYHGAHVDTAAFTDALEAAAKGHRAVCTLHLTNGNPFESPEILSANPLGGLSIEDPGGKPPRLALPNDLRFSAAVLHGEESLVEKPDEVAEAATSLAQRLDVPLWGITNGWDLDHVPHAIAIRKAKALGQARHILLEVAA
ncbi:MAG: hypothetical protein ACYDBQ_08230 [Thermoplasmatota archaeon]